MLAGFYTMHVYHQGSHAYRYVFISLMPVTLLLTGGRGAGSCADILD